MADNTGSGGTIVYTDTNGLNPVALPPYLGGYVVHKFTVSGTLTIPSATNADVLVVAGKGHEQGQTVGTQVLPFDDADTIRALAGAA